MNNFTAEQNRFMEQARGELEKIVALFARNGIELKLSVRRMKETNNVVTLRRLRIVK